MNSTDSNEMFVFGLRRVAGRAAAALALAIATPALIQAQEEPIGAGTDLGGPSGSAAVGGSEPGDMNDLGPEATAASNSRGTQNSQDLSFNETTSEALGKLKPLLDQKKWDDALAILDGVIQKTDASSYDMSVLLDTKAKILVQGKSDYPAAIQPWEAALKLAGAHPNYFAQDQVLAMLQGMAQIHYQVASNMKPGPAQQAEWTKASNYIQRWLRRTKKPPSDQILFYATLLYYRATADPKHPNEALMKRAVREARVGLLQDVHPKDGFYQLLMAAYQQQNNYADAAKLLELQIARQPNPAAHKDYWTELVAFYNVIAGNDQNNPIEQKEFYARAINTLERAQKLGLMKTPKDNYNLVSMYYAAGQIGIAADLMHRGLEAGSIESTPRTWESLAYFEQELGRPLDATNILKEAEKQFPRSGELDYQICQIAQQNDDTEAAYHACSAAIEKGNLPKPYAAWQMLAYLAYELKKYPEALHACEEAMKDPHLAKDSQVVRLKNGILEAMKIDQVQKQAAAAAARQS